MRLPALLFLLLYVFEIPYGIVIEYVEYTQSSSDGQVTIGVAGRPFKLHPALWVSSLKFVDRDGKVGILESYKPGDVISTRDNRVFFQFKYDSPAQMALTISDHPDLNQATRSGPLTLVLRNYLEAQLQRAHAEGNVNRVAELQRYLPLLSQARTMPFENPRYFIIPAGTVAEDHGLVGTCISVNLEGEICPGPPFYIKLDAPLSTLLQYTPRNFRPSTLPPRHNISNPLPLEEPLQKPSLRKGPHPLS
jgi:hypothetical protein